MIYNINICYRIIIMTFKCNTEVKTDKHALVHGFVSGSEQQIRIRCRCFKQSPTCYSEKFQNGLAILLV